MKDQPQTAYVQPLVEDEPMSGSSEKEDSINGNDNSASRRKAVSQSSNAPLAENKKDFDDRTSSLPSDDTLIIKRHPLPTQNEESSSVDVKPSISVKTSPGDDQTTVKRELCNLICFVSTHVNIRGLNVIFCSNLKA